MSEHYDGHILDGKTTNQAFSETVSSFGDIDEMLIALMPEEEFTKEADTYLRRNAKNTAIGVMMYIIGGAFLIGFAGLGKYLGDEDFYAIIGLIILLIITAFATGLIVYSHMSTPPEYSDYNLEKKKEFKSLNRKQSRTLDSILTINWVMITFIYLAVSLSTGAWFITWLIWLPGTVIQEIIKTVYELRYGHE